ncbi:hypothetical protein KQX54_002148 [Cotesia glomerata]|uniref:CCHC-type domain-containing protein n=1 Tax=Cotesia glomerata TaxID=32391 RepID=A0AAV7I8R6_COTGL|nr:hypothetical protein KQX54_002148 [Cotesia glomerata]
MPKKRGHRAGRRIQARRSREKLQNSKENEKVVENIPLPQITNIRRVQRRLKIVILNNSEEEIDTGLYLPRVRFPDSDPLGLLVRGEKLRKGKLPRKSTKRPNKKGVKIIIPKTQILSPKPYPLSLKELRRDPNSEKKKEPKKEDAGKGNRTVNFAVETPGKSAPNKPVGQNKNPNGNSTKPNNSNDQDICRKCEKPGHFAKNCPDITCQVCFTKGHTAKNCPQINVATQENPYANVRCQLCGGRGHTARYCEENPNRRYIPSQLMNRISANQPPNQSQANQFRTNKYCDYHKNNSHNTEDCRVLQQTANYLQTVSQTSFPRDAGRNNRPSQPVNMIQEVTAETDSE